MARGKRAGLAPLLAAMLTMGACGAADRQTTDLVTKVELPSRPPVDVRVRLQPTNARQAARFQSAARATLALYADRFGVMPLKSLTVVDAGWPPESAQLSADAVTVGASTRWLALGLAMEPEMAVTRAVGGLFWRKALSCNADAGWFVDGLNQYTATPVIASQFAVQQTPPAFSYAEERYFAGFVPFVIRAPLRNATAGNGLADYRLNPGVDLRRPVNEARDRRSAAAKTALAMGTLERWIGAPTWDAVLQEFASRGWTTCPSARDLGRVAQEVTGLDLSWFFSEVFDSVDRFDYGIDALTSEASLDRAAVYRTTVSVRRYGDAAFTGTSTPRMGSFESGRGMTIRVAFEDGSDRVDYWDGRDRSKLFVYESASAVRWASLDPDEVLLLDTNRTNNTRMRIPENRRAATKWAARWTIWLEDLLLTFASLT